MTTTDKRGHQLGFCTVCIHRKSTLEHGLICGLTNKVADFETECPSFSLDIPVIVKRRITLEKKMLDRFHPTLDFVEKFLNSTRTRLTNKEAFNSPLYIATKKMVFRESDKSDITMLVFSSLITIFCIIYFFFKPEHHIVLLIAFVAFVAGCFFGYRALSYNYEVQLTITEYGLQTPKETIYWSEIMDYYLSEKEYSKREIFYRLVILTASGIIKTIPLNFLEIEPQMIIKKINQQRKVYYHDSY